MTSARTFAILISLVALVITAAPAHARTVGQVIDDVTLVTEIKAKLAADKISNLIHVGVKADSGVVTLSGTVDSPERRARAAQIASEVNGVKGVINDIQVKTARTTPPASTVTPTAPGSQGDGWQMGTVRRADPATSQIVLSDGTVVRITSA